jgi:hypothetical protein
MAIITVEIPDEMVDQITELRERLPEIIALSVRQPALPAAVYQHIVAFLASNPSPAAIAACTPTQEMQDRLRLLIERSHAGVLTATETRELDEYERIEHLMVLMKAGSLPYLTSLA